MAEFSSFAVVFLKVLTQVLGRGLGLRCVSSVPIRRKRRLSWSRTPWPVSYGIQPVRSETHLFWSAKKGCNLDDSWDVDISNQWLAWNVLPCAGTYLADIRKEYESAMMQWRSSKQRTLFLHSTWATTHFGDLSTCILEFSVLSLKLVYEISVTSLQFHLSTKGLIPGKGERHTDGNTPFGENMPDSFFKLTLPGVSWCFPFLRQSRILTFWTNIVDAMWKKNTRNSNITSSNRHTENPNPFDKSLEIDFWGRLQAQDSLPAHQVMIFQNQS